MNDFEYLSLINEIGFLLLKSGAEIYRVEESITRMCQGYGFTNVEVFAIPTYYTLSLKLKDGTLYSTTIRSRHNKVNLDRLFELNHLVRLISNQKIEYEDIKDKINDIKNTKNHPPLICLGYIVAAAMFCVFFNGNMSEMIVAGIIGGILYIYMYFNDCFGINSIVKTLLSSMILASCALFFHHLGIIDNYDSVIIGTLMLLVPGIAITNSLRDLIDGDYVSGLARMIEAILVASSIAVGVGIVLMILGGA